MTNSTCAPAELLACPFCGEAPVLPSGDGSHYEIECGGCGQAMASVQIRDLMTYEERASSSFIGYRYSEEYVERAKAAAIDNWNRRATPPAHHIEQNLGMVGALVTALDGLLSITQDSAGVAGYHLNGEIAEWDEFPEVGTARDVLSRHRERADKPAFFGIDLAEGALDDGPWRDAIIAQGWTPPAEPAADLHVWRATTKFGDTCHFGEASYAKAWAGKDGKIERVDLKPAPDLQVVEQSGAAPDGYVLVTAEQIERHATTAWECPPQSRVVLVSSLKRLAEKNAASPKATAARELLALALHKSFPLFDDAGLDQFIHCCEHSILQERKRLHAILDGAAPQPIEKVGVLRDAMRYRWLRDPENSPALVIDKRGEFIARDEFGGGGYYNYEYRAGDELDAAIDAALSDAPQEELDGQA